ncbi:MAG: hypothetical protein ACN6RG_02050 [Stenotrophomonas sp.]
MNDEQSAGVLNVSRLPYVIVRSTLAEPNRWIVAWQVFSHTRTRENAGIIRFRISHPGKYRVYIREPLVTHELNSVYAVPQHTFADGRDSGREIQPLVELDVVEDAECNFSVQVMHPNGLARDRGAGRDQIPNDGQRRALPPSRLDTPDEPGLDLGRYTLSFQLWADASRAYGISHPIIAASRFREALELIYGESLIRGDGAGVEAHDRPLRTETLLVEFDHQSTTGGRGRLSFREDSGMQNNRMTPEESLRRTHPSTMEFLLQMMTDLGVHFARSTGAWRPHYGSTRHRYAAALDVTHMKANVVEGNQNHEVEIHFHRAASPESHPLVTSPRETPERRRMRELSQRAHVYMASAKANGDLGWMGGPWTPTFGQLGVQVERSADRAFETDTVHSHHIHITRGTGQEL